jgi:hypothetical protein
LIAVQVDLFTKLHHHIWHLNIFFSGVLCGDLENEVLRVGGDFLPADRGDEIAQPN